MEGSGDVEGVHNYTLQILLPNRKLQLSCTLVKQAIVTLLTFKSSIIYPKVEYRLWMDYLFIYCSKYLSPFRMIMPFCAQTGTLVWSFFTSYILFKHVRGIVQGWL